MEFPFRVRNRAYHHFPPHLTDHFFRIKLSYKLEFISIQINITKIYKNPLSIAIIFTEYKTHLNEIIRLVSSFIRNPLAGRPSRIQGFEKLSIFAYFSEPHRLDGFSFSFSFSLLFFFQLFSFFYRQFGGGVSETDSDKLIYFVLV